jgi:hypothetical protein
VSLGVRLLAPARDSRRQRLDQIRHLSLTQSHHALRAVATIAPDVFDVVLRFLPPPPAADRPGRGRHARRP